MKASTALGRAMALAEGCAPYMALGRAIGGSWEAFERSDALPYLDVVCSLPREDTYPWWDDAVRNLHMAASMAMSDEAGGRR